MRRRRRRRRQISRSLPATTFAIRERRNKKANGKERLDLALHGDAFLIIGTRDCAFLETGCDLRVIKGGGGASGTISQSDENDVIHAVSAQFLPPPISKAANCRQIPPQSSPKQSLRRCIH